MESTQWERVQAVFHAVADVPESERRAALESTCDGDSGLMAEVLALLEEDRRDSSVLDRTLGDIAHRTLDTDIFKINLRDFGPYQILGLLGEGGMGAVYLARRRDLGSLVAIKVLRDAWLSPSRRERFQSEQKTLAQLNHPNIARLYDAGVLEDGTPWFAMEYVKGLTPTEYCRVHICSLKERLRIFREVCKAVQYAHGQAVLHRDLKPSNILIGEDGSVKLLDFGIASQLEGTDRPARDKTLLRLVTLGYAAPEQLRGEPVGIYTDVYSLGVIIYELLAGQTPYDTSQLAPGEVMDMVVHHEPLRPSVAARHSGHWTSFVEIAVSQSNWNDLDVLCLTAIHKDLQRRYQSVEAMVRDIDHFQRNEPLEARPDSLRYTAGKFIKRNSTQIFAIALTFVVIAGLVAFFMVRLTKARNAALAETERTNRVEQFTLNLFQGDDKEAGPAEDLRVITLVDRGVQNAQTLNGEPEAQADLYQTLGSIYQQLGKLDRAETLLQAALKERRSLQQPDQLAIADNLVALGLLRSEQNRPKEAEKVIREGLAILDADRSAKVQERAKATSALGQALLSGGAYRQAVVQLNLAAAMQMGKESPTPELAETLDSLSEAHLYLGDYSISESVSLQALAIERKLYGDFDPHIAEEMNTLGQIQEEWGHYDKAEQHLRQALAITQTWYGTDHPETASKMTGLAQTLVFEGKYEEASSLLRQALAIQEHVYGPTHPRVAYVLNELGGVAVMQGDFDGAEVDFRRALTMYRSTYGDVNDHVAVATSNLATTYFKKKQYDSAERLFKEAVSLFIQTRSADNIDTGIAQIKLGRTLLYERRYREGEQQTLAGYQTLVKQTSPSTGYILGARQDLATDYDALGEPDKARKFRTTAANASSTAMKTANPR